MALAESILLASKFRGCLVAPVKPYTDDTAMTKCIAESLLEHKKLDASDLAKRFVKEYFSDPRRGYGANVVDVFRKLRTQKFVDPFGPAREQFEGSGSYGNGAAMRVSPVALFCHDSYDELVSMARVSAEVTHANHLGFNGAVLQAIAVHQSLHLNAKEGLDVTSFVLDLITKMAAIEKDDEGLGLEDPTPYQTQLKHVKELLDRGDGVEDAEVVRQLGNNVAALFSVPTAIYCFLRAQEDIEGIKTDNPFRRTLQYAISLGGDTDTIASMAGAIAGAYYGHGAISEALQRHCELLSEVVKYAEDLYVLVAAQSNVPP
ncbi:ADP-ribosylhydrolase ARH3-like isoform X2 [Bacillus rossius redtenbacheri]|uniref:ADP-ribosylhydrolase ARH3-like isoform X2 n=1 Tax=Bacillus rossius redtenbacheri TaxID=93214 RepID=UPI002FDD94EF